MFNKKKPETPPRNKNRNLAQFGLIDIAADGGADSDDGNESDLEAELLALATGSGGSKPKRPARRAQPQVNLNVMIAESMKDIASDEELSGDDDDPDLLNELSEITGAPELESEPVAPVQAPQDVRKLLDDRLKMYVQAEINAKEAGETSRARRFGRGIKTLKDMIKQAHAGSAISADDIPPEVTVNVQKKDPPANSDIVEPQPPNIPDAGINAPDPITIPNERPVANDASPSISDEADLLKLLTTRRDQYKIAALNAKRDANSALAVKHIKIAKQFEIVIAAVRNGQPVDTSLMPGPPSDDLPPTPPKAECEHQTQSIPEQPVPVSEESGEPPEEPEPTLITASSVAEALQQRLDVYRKQEEAAKSEGNSSKMRRMGRIVKQFEGAIKSHNAGKPIPFEELPTPPGYAPIPGTQPPAPNTTPVQPTKPELSKPQRPAPVPPQQPSSAATTRTTGNRTTTTHVEKQVALLQQRQREFKEAALAAKKNGEIDQAKELLRSAKGFDQLIIAAQSGLPIDMNSLPLAPSAKSKLEDEFTIVMGEECTEDDSSIVDIVARLETQLAKQLRMCLVTRDHHKAIGDVTAANRFENLALSVSKDIDVVRIAKRTAYVAPPKFHYETREFSIVKCFTNLNDNDLEVSILRGINYNCSNPKEIDTYVKIEFPYPQEEPVQERSHTVKDTNNPEYNYKHVFQIQRTARPCQRVFKRHAIKLEVLSRGGFFRSDTLLGSLSVKLQPLENQCEIHESFDLMDGRKKVGGQLEVQIRLRNPLLSKEVEQVSEKWLVLDH